MSSRRVWSGLIATLTVAVRASGKAKGREWSAHTSPCETRRFLFEGPKITPGCLVAGKWWGGHNGHKDDK